MNKFTRGIDLTMENNNSGDPLEIWRTPTSVKNALLTATAAQKIARENHHYKDNPSYKKAIEMLKRCIDSHSSSLTQQGDQVMADGKYKKAMRYYNESNRHYVEFINFYASPKERDEYIKKRKANTAKLENAIGKYKNFLDNSAKAFVVKGDKMMDEGKYEEAVDQYGKADKEHIKFNQPKFIYDNRRLRKEFEEKHKKDRRNIDKALRKYIEATSSQRNNKYVLFTDPPSGVGQDKLNNKKPGCFCM